MASEVCVDNQPQKEDNNVVSECLHISKRRRVLPGNGRVMGNIPVYISSPIESKVTPVYAKELFTTQSQIDLFMSLEDKFVYRYRIWLPEDKLNPRDKAWFFTYLSFLFRGCILVHPDEEFNRDVLAGIRSLLEPMKKIWKEKDLPIPEILLEDIKYEIPSEEYEEDEVEKGDRWRAHKVRTKSAGFHISHFNSGRQKTMHSAWFKESKGGVQKLMEPIFETPPNPPCFSFHTCFDKYSYEGGS